MVYKMCIRVAYKIGECNRLYGELKESQTLSLRMFFFIYLDLGISDKIFDMFILLESLHG